MNSSSSTVSGGSVTVRLKGGLGNQLFQYATARALSMETGRQLLVDVGWFNRKKKQRGFRLDSFLMTPELVSLKKSDLQLLKIRKKIGAGVFKGFSASKPAYITEPKDLSYQRFDNELPEHVLLEGYWQSQKYFESIRSTLLSELQPGTDIDSSTLFNPEPHTVAVHIRRGDYLQSANSHVVTTRYITDAMELFDDNTRFLFFSDDIQWCTEQFGSDRIAFSSQPTDVMDLLQMARCQHNIIANSSFSWWGAWLNTNKNQRVIAPQPWTESGNTHRDILPAHWERLPI